MCAALCLLHILSQNHRLQTVQPTENYTYADMEQDLLTLKKKYPRTLRVNTYGHSLEGRPLYAAVAGEPNARFAVLIGASMHAREHMTSLLVMAQLAHLLQEGVPKDTAFHILPMLNPDGVTLSQTGMYTPAQYEMYLRDVENGFFTGGAELYMRRWKANARGTDLNRNFDAMWERIDERPYPAHAFYRGEHPLSEPESKALADYARQTSFDATLSYHATGSVLFYDFGDDTSINEKSRSLAETVHQLTAYRLIPDKGDSFGGFKDWAILELKTPSLTIEIGREAAPLALEEFADIFARNREVPAAVAKWIFSN